MCQLHRQFYLHKRFECLRPRDNNKHLQTVSMSQTIHISISQTHRDSNIPTPPVSMSQTQSQQDTLSHCFNVSDTKTTRQAYLFQTVKCPRHIDSTVKRSTYPTGCFRCKVSIIPFLTVSVSCTLRKYNTYSNLQCPTDRTQQTILCFFKLCQDIRYNENIIQTTAGTLTACLPRLFRTRFLSPFETIPLLTIWDNLGKFSFCFYTENGIVCILI